VREVVMPKKVVPGEAPEALEEEVS